MIILKAWNLHFWSIDIECEKPNEQINEEVVVLKSNGNKYGNYIHYGCKTGYNINNGSSFRTCLKDGKWSGKSPICSRNYIIFIWFLFMNINYFLN